MYKILISVKVYTCLNIFCYTFQIMFHFMINKEQNNCQQVNINVFVKLSNLDIKVAQLVILHIDFVKSAFLEVSEMPVAGV